MSDCIETSHVFTFIHDEYLKGGGKKLFALEGSSGAAKTWGGIDFVLEYCRINAFDNKRLTIGRETYRDCLDTISYDFIKRLKQIGWYNQKFHSQSHPQKYFLFGNEIDFTGWSNNGQPSKRQDLLWFNEILESNEEDFKQYNQRTNDVVIFDWNPKVTDHWVYNKLLSRPDCYYKHCTLFQNPFLPEGQKQEILKYEPTPENIANGTADDIMWAIYALGLRTAIKGLIFPSVKWVDKFPENQNFIIGLDFGFSIDPTAIVKYCNIEDDDYYELLCYEPIDSAIVLSDYMQKIGLEPWMYINADCSDRYNDVEMIRDLKDLGWFNIHKVNKGKGINWRIGRMKQKRINIVHNINAKREQENYKWREINGIMMNEPVDKYNHFWDGAGYAKLGWLKLNGNY